MIGPVESFLKLFRRHPAWMINDMLAVIFRPVPVKDPPGAVVAVEERGAGKWCEHIEVGELHVGLG